MRVETSEGRLEVLRAQSARLTPGALLQKIRILTAAEADARFATQPRVILEMALLKLCRPEMDPSIEGLAARIEALEQQAVRTQGPSALDAQRFPAGAPEAPPAETPPPAGRAPRRDPRDRPSRADAVADAAILPAAVDASAPGVGIEFVCARWGRLMDEVKQRSRPIHAFLMESAPQAVEGTSLVLAVRHKFHLESLQELKNRRIVEELLATVMGAPLRLGLVLGEGKASLVPPVSPEGAAAPGGSGTLVEEAVRRFGNPVQEIRHPE